MLLSPEVIATLNARCVVYTVNVFPSDPAADARVSQLRSWASANAPQLTPLLDQRVDIGPYLLGPDGSVLRQVRRPTEVVSAVRSAAEKAGVEEKPPVVSVKPAWFDGYEPGDLALKLTARFVEKPGQRLPKAVPWQVPILHAIGTDESNARMYRTRLTSPTREGVLLKGARADGLFPPAGATSWEVPRKLATDLLWLFRPSTHQFRITRDDVREVTLTAALEGPDRVRLAGSVKVRQWWFPVSTEGMWLGDALSDDYWAESPVVGYADLDLAVRKVKHLRLVTDGGTYRGLDGTSLPFEAVLYSVSAEEAAACTVR